MITAFVAALVVAAGSATGVPQEVNGSILYTVNPISLSAYTIDGTTLLWNTPTAITSPHAPIVVPDGPSSVVIVTGDGLVQAFDGLTGDLLWGTNGDVRIEHGLHVDVHRQAFVDQLVFPHGPPRRSADDAPTIGVDTSSADILVQSRTGEVLWSHIGTSDDLLGYFVPTSAASYDVVFRNNLMRVDADDFADVRWTRALNFRSSLAIPDITGDGKHDLFTRANFTDSLMLLNGVTGATIMEFNYGSFDVLGLHLLPGADDGSVDVICAAQGSAAGGLRRYRASGGTLPVGSVVWTCDGQFNNQSMLGLLTRADGDTTIVSGWRHQNKAIGVLASTGDILWSSIPVFDADTDAIGASDLTGDGNEDVFGIFGNQLRLYDGLTGEPVRSFAPLTCAHAATWVRFLASEPCTGDLVTSTTFSPPPDGVVDGADLAVLLGNWGECK